MMKPVIKQNSQKLLSMIFATAMAAVHVLTIGVVNTAAWRLAKAAPRKAPSVTCTLPNQN